MGHARAAAITACTRTATTLSPAAMAWQADTIHPAGRHQPSLPVNQATLPAHPLPCCASGWHAPCAWPAAAGALGWHAPLQSWPSNPRQQLHGRRCLPPSERHRRHLRRCPLPLLPQTRLRRHAAAALASAQWWHNDGVAACWGGTVTACSQLGSTALSCVCRKQVSCMRSTISTLDPTCTLHL